MKRSYPVLKGVLKYLLSSTNEHGIHSPFLFHLYNNVLNSKDQYYCFSEIEEKRKSLLTDTERITGFDYGAGSIKNKSPEKTVKEIAHVSLSKKEVAQRYFRLINYLKPANILELGTSLGISTAYMAIANKDAHIYTFEGNPELIKIAANVFEDLDIANVIQIEGNLDHTLEKFLHSRNKQQKIDFVLLDANHRSEALFKYISLIEPHLSQEAFLIVDDISWSDDMRFAWTEIIKRKCYTLTFENMSQGFLCTHTNLTKQHFYLRF